jgi:hypothetical protein
MFRIGLMEFSKKSGDGRPGSEITMPITSPYFVVFLPVPVQGFNRI